MTQTSQSEKKTEINNSNNNQKSQTTTKKAKQNNKKNPNWSQILQLKASLSAIKRLRLAFWNKEKDFGLELHSKCVTY